MGLLAMVSDAWVIGWAIGSFVIALVMSLVQIWLVGKAREMGDLKAEVKKSADDAIDARFKALGAEIRSSLVELSASVRQIESRLQKGDGTFDKLGDRYHALELKLVKSVEESLRETASKKDLESLQEKVDALRVQVAKLAA